MNKTPFRASSIGVSIALAAACLALHSPSAVAATTLYAQDFEHPTGFVNEGGDVNHVRTVNQLYGDQPPGFTFSQPFTDETLHVGGTEAFGVGYKDPEGVAGHYVVGMLSDRQPDLLSMSFSVGKYRYLNFGLDVSSIDLDRFGGPFVVPGEAPVFRVSLFDNPSGQTNLSGNGSLLGSETITGVAAANQYTFDWTHAVLGFDTQASTNGQVTLQIDLLSGGYAAMDNFVVVASDERGVIPAIPEPAGWSLALAGLGLLGAAKRRRRAA